MIDYVLTPLPALILFGVLGLAMGSFANVVIDRTLSGETLLGRSYCVGCKRLLTVIDLVPVLSYVFMRGKCRTCRVPIPAEFTLIELLTMAMFVFAAWWSDVSLLSSFGLALAFWAMLVITIIDMRSKMIPDWLTIVLALGSILYHQEFILYAGAGGALLGGGFIGFLWLISRGRWIGSGDIFLAGALGLLLGIWQLMLIALFAAYIGGSVIVLILLAAKKLHRKSQVPFGPMLIGGTLLAFFWGADILAFMFS